MYCSDKCISKLKLKWQAVCQVLGLAHIFCKFVSIFWDLLESLFQRVSTTSKWKVVSSLYLSLSERFIRGYEYEPSIRARFMKRMNKNVWLSQKSFGFILSFSLEVYLYFYTLYILPIDSILSVCHRLFSFAAQNIS